MRKFWMSLLAVVVGYLALAMMVMVALGLAYLILGAEGSYQSRSWNVSTTWVILAIVIGLGSAWCGGRICVQIAHNHVAPKYLIVLILLMGVLYAMTANQADVDAVRTVTPSIFEAMNNPNTTQPKWLLWLNPLLGSIGVAIGSGLLGSGRPKVR